MHFATNRDKASKEMVKNELRYRYGRTVVFDKVKEFQQRRKKKKMYDMID